MPANREQLEGLRLLHNRQYPEAQIAAIGNDSAAVQILEMGRIFWDGTGYPIPPDDREAISTAPPNGAFT